LNIDEPAVERDTLLNEMPNAWLFDRVCGTMEEDAEDDPALL